MVRIVRSRRNGHCGGEENGSDCECSHGYPPVLRPSHSVIASLSPAIRDHDSRTGYFWQLGQ
jgi:hypothetical protein